MKLRFLKILIVFICFVSCEKKTQENEKMKKVIKKAEEINIDFFKGYFIGVRDKRIDEIIYIVGSSDENLPVYFVHFDLISNKVVKINNEQILDNGCKNYLTDNKIKKLVEEFRKLNLCLLDVDSKKNVLINPFQINEPAILFKPVVHKQDKQINYNGFVFGEHIDGWYLRIDK